MKIGRNHILFLSYSVLFFLMSFLDITSINNYRLIFSHKEITSLTKGMDLGSLEQKISTQDDPGFLLLYSFGQYAKGESEVDPRTNSKSFPLALKVFFFGFHLLMIFFLAHTAPEVFSFGTKLVGMLFLLSPGFLSVFYGYDVYVFPIYTAIMSFYSFGKLIQEKLKPLKFTLFAAVVGICEIFRKNSLFLFLPLPGVLILKRSLSIKKKFILLAVFLVTFYTVKSSMGLIFSHQGHTVWHSLHAGLFEYGGCIDEKGNAYPYAIFSQEDARKNGAGICSNGWSDSIQYEISLRHGIKDFYSPAYDEILKGQIIAFVKNYPGELAGLAVIRFFNALSFLPTKAIAPSGHYESLTPFHIFEGIIFLAIFIFWLFREKDLLRRIFFTSTFLFALPGPVLVHSQHIIYNIPLHFIQIMILMEFFTLVFPKKSAE